jgi:hypothetical protein
MSTICVRSLKFKIEKQTDVWFPIVYLKWKTSTSMLNVDFAQQAWDIN